MKLLEEKILQDGQIIGNEIVKIDSFINHQIDPSIIRKFAEEVKKEFASLGIDKILTIETSGIAVAFAVAEEFDNLPLLFAKKSKSKTVDENVYRTSIKSFTRGIVTDATVSKRYLKAGENVLIVDDFLAEGNAALGLLNLCNQAGAQVKGVAVAVEKVFQGGRKKLEDLGIKVFAGASIKAFENNKPVF